MTMNRLWLLVLCIPFSELAAQHAGPQTNIKTGVEKHPPERFMNGQIKHLGDFIDRFNEVVKAGTEGQAALRSLFNEDDLRFPAHGRMAQPYARQVDAFIEWAMTGKTLIPKRGVMRAVVGIKVSYEEVVDTLKVHLRKDYTSDSAAYWHITKVDNLLRIRDDVKKNRAKEASVQPSGLPPNASEVSFLPLLRGLDDYRSLAPFTPCLACRDTAWQKVESALQDGKLTIENVVSNRIYLTAGCWEMELSEFIREKENSGWLISDLFEKNNPVK